MGEQAQAQIHVPPLRGAATATGSDGGGCVRRGGCVSGGGSFSEEFIVTAGLGHVCAPENPSLSSKLPFRPQKIRKVSPESAGKKSSQNDAAGDYRLVATDKAERNRIIPPCAPPPPKMVTRPLSCEGEIDIALNYLRNSDPHLAQLIDLYPPPSFDSFLSPFLALTRSILYQQLAYKAGTSIYTRFVCLCGGEDGVLPDTVLALTPSQLRNIGVSGRKASYLHDLARKYQTGILSDSSILEMDDKSLFTMLTMVNGIGAWSVHMFMIFSLHRPDVLPVGDLRIRKGVQFLYELEQLPRPSQMDQLCAKWKPYRSVASWYLWRFDEGKGGSSSAVVVAAAVSFEQQHQDQQLHQRQHQDQQLHQHQQQQPQLIDPINSILSLGACAWGQ